MTHDWENKLVAAENTRVGGKHKPAQAIEDVTVIQADKATGKKKTAKGEKDNRYHGSYRQITIRLRPEVFREMEEWGVRLGVSNAALQRYLMWRGLKALEEGERPELSQRTEMREY